MGAFLIQADSAAEVPRVAKAVDDEFETTPFQTKSESEQAFTLSFLAFVGNLKLFIMAIFGAVTFTILLVSGNTISMSVRERIREVGILKTLGFTPGAILGIVLGESAVISAIGGFIGSLLAAAMCVTDRPQSRQCLHTSVENSGHLAAGRFDQRGSGIVHRHFQLVRPGLERIAHQHPRSPEVLWIKMAIPLSYNLRNLVVRKTTTIVTALGIALTVAVLLAVLALVNGLQTAFQSSGNPLQILVMRKGATAELSSAVTRGDLPGSEIHGRHRARWRRAHGVARNGHRHQFAERRQPQRDERDAARASCPWGSRCATT